MPPIKKATPSLSDLINKKDKDKDTHEHSPDVKSPSDNSDKNDTVTAKEDETNKSNPDNVTHEDKNSDAPAFKPESNMNDMPSLTPITNEHQPQDVEEPPKAQDNDNNKDEDKMTLSRQTVATIPNKTPGDISAESADETEARYGIKQHVNEEDLDNPNVTVDRTSVINQVPSGTHLHPDIARDLLNRGISEQTTDIGQVRRNATEGFVFAPDAENNDKF